MRYSILLLFALFLGCNPSSIQDPSLSSEQGAANAAPKKQPVVETHPTEKDLPVSVDLSLNTEADRSKQESSQILSADEKTVSQNQAGTDWPRFLGPTGDSKSTEIGILTKWPEEGPHVVWQIKLGISYGACSISGGKLYQFDRHGNKARLTCMNCRTGDELWRFEYPTDYIDYLGYNNGPRTSPVIDNERVYIFGVEGMLYCLKVEDGSEIWKVDTKKDFNVIQNHFGVGSTPIIEDELLIANIGGSPKESQGLGQQDLDRVVGHDSGIVAFDKRTGKVKYQITDELASYASPFATTIDGRRWCFVFARGGLIGFEPESGKVDFHYPWRARIRDSVNASSPVVVGDEVFISETYGPGSSLLKVKPGGYQILWKDDPLKRQKVMQTHWNTSIYHEGFLYGSSGRHSNNAELRCVEWKTGKVMWSVPKLSRASLLYVDGHFVCLGEYGALRLIKANPHKFEQLAYVLLRESKKQPQIGNLAPRPLLKYPAWAAPILSNGLLYVRGDDRLVCLELIPAKL